VYEICFEQDDPAPRPHDDEVESFRLVSEDELLGAILADEVRPSCAAAHLDLLVRHGRLSIDQTPRLQRFLARLHRPALYVVPS
jgi:hypothetical protein